MARMAREMANPIMTTQQGRGPLGESRSFLVAEQSPGRDSWLGFSGMSREKKDFSAVEGQCAHRRGWQRTLHLTPRPPLLWQDTQGWPDPTLTAAAKKTGQSRTDPGGIACELSGDTRPGGLGRNGAWAGPSTSLGQSLPP